MATLEKWIVHITENEIRVHTTEPGKRYRRYKNDLFFGSVRARNEDHAARLGSEAYEKERLDISKLKECLQQLKEKAQEEIDHYSSPVTSMAEDLQINAVGQRTMGIVKKIEKVLKGEE